MPLQYDAGISPVASCTYCKWELSSDYEMESYESDNTNYNQEQKGYDLSHMFNLLVLPLASSLDKSLPAEFEQDRKS
jgi:hypothetical protein